MLNNDLQKKTARGAERSQRPRCLTCSQFARLSGRALMRGRRSCAPVCLARVRQMTGCADPPKIHRQTHPRTCTHKQAPFPSARDMGVKGYTKRLMSSRKKHKSKYNICLGVGDSVSTLRLLASDPIMIDDSICVWTVGSLMVHSTKTRPHQIGTSPHKNNKIPINVGQRRTNVHLEERQNMDGSSAVECSRTVWIITRTLSLMLHLTALNLPPASHNINCLHVKRLHVSC